VPVKVDLGNATEFDLKVEDGGGGVIFRNTFDQADWADARVTLADGKTVWLGDLPTDRCAIPLPLKRLFISLRRPAFPLFVEDVGACSRLDPP